MISSEPKSVDALGHDWGEWEEVDSATYDSAGLKRHTCGRCGHDEEETIPQLERTSIEGAEVSGLDNLTYGDTINVIVTLGETVLTPETDYEIVIEPDDEEADYGDAGEYTYTITGKGAYEGEIEGTFTIAKADRENFTVSIEGWIEGEQSAMPESTYDGIVDVEFFWKKQDADDATYAPYTGDWFEAGSYTLKGTIAETKNYHAAEATCDFEVAEREQPEFKAEFYSGTSVIPAENIVLSFFATIDDEVKDGAYVIIRYNHYGEDTSMKLELGNKNKQGLYQFNCPLTASEMAIEVTAELYLADSDEPVSVKTSSVKEYYNKVMRSNQTDELKDAVTAMINYGGYVQDALELNTNLLANADCATDLSDVEIVSENTFVKPEKTVGGVTYAGAAVVTRDQVIARYFFSGTPADGVTFKVNGVEVTPEKKNGLWCVEAAPVRAKTMDSVNKIEVIAEDGSISFTHSAFNYAISSVALAESEGATEKQIKEALAMKAMYEYYVKVKNYLDNRT